MKHAVILANLGAPSRLEEVKPFLRALFSDPDIFKFPFGKMGQQFFSSMIAAIRAPKSRKYYQAIGGGSPLHENTVAQARKLEAVLAEKGDYSVFPAQRYCHPFLTETADRIREGKFTTITLIPLFPQYSTTTTQSIINEWQRHAPNLDNVTIVQRFYNHPGFIRACVKRINEKLELFETPPHILFSAHSIPVKRSEQGDSYQKEIEATVELIVNKLGLEFNYSLCYQSRVGPVEWLGPDIIPAIDQLVDGGVKQLLVVPVAFVSEHLETLYELDIKIKEYALSKGIERYERALTVQDDDDFIDALKRLVLESVE